MSVYQDEFYQTPEFKEFAAAIGHLPITQQPSRVLYAAIHRARINPNASPHLIAKWAIEDAQQSLVRTSAPALQLVTAGLTTNAAGEH